MRSAAPMTMAPTPDSPLTGGRPRVALRTRARRVGLPLSGVVGVLVLWALSVELLKIPPYIVPSPFAVVQALADDWLILIGHAQYTATVIVAGFLVAVAVAIPLALLIAFSETLSAIIYPLLVSSQAVPKVALAPLILVWLGFGPRTGILVTVLISFFPVVIDTVLGLRSMPVELRYLALSMGAGRVRTFFKIRVPYALPYVFSGLKIGITLAVVGGVVGEFVGSNQGLGYFLLVASSTVRTAEVFADIVVLSGVAVILFTVIETAERVAVPWTRRRKG